ncbi:MAG: hypothetical protein QG653_429 [Patescibacteria group bacterium]|nr:hypothetical protein [Patescibacteria group bacterium]
MLPPEIHIRRFTLKDARLFSKLRINIDNESDFLLAKKGERRDTGLHIIVKLIISQRRTVTFLAFDGKEAIGYVSLVFPKFLKLSGNAYLTIALREKYRGKGIGSMLMEKAESFAKEKNIRRIELEVFGKNQPAIELYKKRDYQVEGIKKDAIQTPGGFDDIIIMTKRLH